MEYRYENQHYIFTFDPDTILYSFFDKKQTSKLKGVSFFASINKLGSEIEFSSREAELGCEWSKSPWEDELGKGEKLTVCAKGFGTNCILEATFKFYEQHPYFAVSLQIKNEGGSPIKVNALGPFGLWTENLSSCELGGSPSDWSIFKNGWQSWSPSRVFSVKDKDLLPRFSMARKVTLNDYSKFQKRRGYFISDWNTAIFDRKGRGSLFLGALTMDRLSTQMRIYVQPPEDLMEISAFSLLEEMPLNEGETLQSEEIFIEAGPNPFGAFLRYAKAVNARMKAKPLKEVPLIWCSWYHYFHRVSESDILHNLNLIKQKQGEFNFEYIQIDDGYQKRLGDWTESNQKFPSGLEALARKIKEAGFKPGIWLAPFLVHRRSKVAKEHPHWLLRDKKGRLIKGAYNPRWSLLPMLVLDPTHPEVLEWLKGLIKKFVEEWGYRYLKLDFLYAGALKAKYYDRTANTIEALRKGLKAIREAAGDAFIEGCGCPLGAGVGLVDGMRIAPDTAPKWNSKATRLLKTESVPSLENSLANGMMRFFCNNEFWINHIDCLLLRDKEINLNDNEFLFMLNLIALMGGMLVISDDLASISPERWEKFRKIFPLIKKAAVPVDMFSKDRPEIFCLSINKPFESWKIVGVFNWSPNNKSIELKFQELGLKSSHIYHIYDFWARKYCGMAREKYKVSDIPPHGSVLLSIRPHRDRAPSLISTSLHYSQGAYEIQDFIYSPGEKKLEMIIEHPWYKEAFISLYLPDGFYLTGVRSSTKKVNLEAIEGDLLCVSSKLSGKTTITLSFRT